MTADEAIAAMAQRHAFLKRQWLAECNRARKKIADDGGSVADDILWLSDPDGLQFDYAKR